MPFSAEREAAEREWSGRKAQAIGQLIHAGIREAISILDLEHEWMRKQRGGDRSK